MSDYVKNVNGGTFVPQDNSLQQAQQSWNMLKDIIKLQQDTQKAETALTKTQQSSETKNEPVKIYKGAPGETIHIPLPSEYLPSGWQYGAGVGALASAGRLISDFFRPDPSGYSINADGDVVNAHGVVQPRGSSRTEAIRSALLDASQPIQPQAPSAQVTSTNQPAQNPALEDAGKAATQMVGSIASAGAAQGAVQKANPEDLNIANVRALLNGSNKAVPSAYLSELYNDRKYDMAEKMRKMGEETAHLGGTADLMTMASNVLENKSVDTIVREYLANGGIKDENGENRAGLSHKIQSLAQEQGIHPAFAAQIVFQSLNQKGWFDKINFGTTSVGDALTSVDKDVSARVKAIKTNKEVVNATLRNLLKLRQQQTLLDNYEKQISEATTELEGRTNWLKQYDPDRTPWYAQEADGIMRDSVMQRELVKQYVDALENFKKQKYSK